MECLRLEESKKLSEITHSELFSNNIAPLKNSSREARKGLKLSELEV